MSKTKKLQRQIEKKLDQLQELIDKLDEVRLIKSDDEETWNSDVLYNLTANLKEALALLEDKESPKEKDPWGKPLILEEGLCSLMDSYLEEDEEEDYD